MTVDEMVGWYHQLNGHEFEQAPEKDKDLSFEFYIQARYNVKYVLISLSIFKCNSLSLNFTTESQTQSILLLILLTFNLI